MEEKSQVYLLGEFLLDVGQRKLSRAGAGVHLTNLPFRVLVHLIKHHDRLVTREELLDRFWEGKDVYEDSLRKAVGAIRKALNDRQEQPQFIETRYGEGYRYIGPLAEQGDIAGREVEPDKVPLVIPLPSSPLSPLPLPLHHTRLAAIFGLAAGMAILLAIASAFYRNNNRGIASSVLPRSLAVLPLKNLTGDPAQDYFGDGVTESLINELAKVRDLKVIARNSAFAFKGKEVDVREIGRRLGVAAVLEGSLRRDAETVRVSVRLVSAEDGRVLWTGDTTRPLKEIIAVQDEIGCSVAESLKAVLCRDPNHKPGTSNLAAYDVYLKARDQRQKGDVKRAAELFEQAVNADPNYALAWAGLAEANAVMEVNAMAPPRSMIGKARECAFKAIALDSSLASPYAALGLLAAFSDRDWATGERYFGQALASNPNYAIAHAWYAGTLLAQGKFAAAESQYLRARELDPLNTGFINNLAETYYYWRQPDRCLTQAVKALELEPVNGWAWINQMKCLSMQGRYDEALQAAQKTGHATSGRLTILAQSGRLAEARGLLPLIIKDYSRTSPYGVASAQAALGDQEAAFAWLRKAADQQQADLISLKVDPAFDPLRNDPRLAELLQRVGLQE
ncbi:MAG: winged helix-turn-helix domain-containing protein [Acidobacteriota bacterium]|nr:winged helix-turn-helix domain-containing protein [Acidobacteriota bacterium]